MDWTKIKVVPKYNPWRFKLCRELDGLTIAQFAKRAELSTERYRAIEKGDAEPSDGEVKKITASQSHVIIGFFMIWDECETKFMPYGGIPVPINYYKYKIFRDVNPPEMMKAV